MKIIRKIEVFGDSILKGIQVNPQSKRYHINNNIDIGMLSDAFSLCITNHSKFGCTVTKGKAMLDKFLSETKGCTAILMDYGGNDCDFKWQSISENPDAAHEPNTPIGKFTAIYTELIKKISDKGIRPIVANLPPLEPQRYFDWLSKGLNKENILRWLEGVNTIYRYQENYSRTVEEIAENTGAMLVDLRGVFLKHRHIGRYLCEDGIHPNTEGQSLITQELARFCSLAMPTEPKLAGI
ncbi:MAG: SGNH/GDSL hydrolase family protein [Oscillospiraceae bacterium]|nr:SGNH/GDSL hydrolase family protein [Oscillospiraceae bacterium]